MTLISAGIVNAADRTVIDDFEDTPILGDWTNVGGDESATTNSRYIQSGSQAVLFSAFEDVYLANDSGRNYAKGEGDLFIYRNNASGATDQSWYRFGAQDNANSYFVDVDSNNSEFRIAKEVSGTTTELAANTSLTIPGDDMVEVKVTWDDGTLGGSDGDITARLRNVATDTVLDTLTTNDTESTLQDNVYVGLVAQGMTDVVGVDWISKEVA